MATTTFREIKFSDDDVVNPNDWIPEGDYNPNRVLPWLIHNHGVVKAVVFAENESDAFDVAADAGKLNHARIEDTDLEDYTVVWHGNASEPFDPELLNIVDLPNPRRSFVAQFKESFP